MNIQQIPRIVLDEQETVDNYVRLAGVNLKGKGLSDHFFSHDVLGLECEVVVKTASRRSGPNKNRPPVPVEMAVPGRLRIE